MANWEHKDRSWNSHNYEILEGEYTLQNTNTQGPHGKSRSFSEWLDWQCTDGWEVIKIHRSGDGRSTWCVFRRKIRV